MIKILKPIPGISAGQIEKAVANIEASGLRPTYRALAETLKVPTYMIYNSVYLEKVPNINSVVLDLLDGERLLSDIAAEIGVSRQAVSYAVDRLVRSGKAEKINKRFRKK